MCGYASLYECGEGWATPHSASGARVSAVCIAYVQEHLKKDAADPPHVHLVGVEAICEEALGRAVPSRRDVLSVGLLRVDAAARAKVGQLELFVGYQDILHGVP